MSELHWNKYNAAADLDPFPDIRYQCPLCYKSFKEEYDKCPNCGKVIKGESHYEKDFINFALYCNAFNNSTDNRLCRIRQYILYRQHIGQRFCFRHKRGRSVENDRKYCFAESQRRRQGAFQARRNIRLHSDFDLLGHKRKSDNNICLRRG